MNFLPIAILAYLLNGGSILVDKVMLKKSLPNPIAFTFYVNALQLLVIFLIPFGFHPRWGEASTTAVFSGVIGFFALYAFFKSLKENEASIVGPVVGVANPLFALILGGIFLGQVLSQTQYLAFFILLLGALILTFNLWSKNIQLGKKLMWMILAGFLFGLSYILLREAFLKSTFLNGLILSRASSSIVALALPIFPKLRREIFSSSSKGNKITSKTTLTLLGAGQVMGAAAVLLITFAVSLADPALVNSLFGLQYVPILVAALLLAKKHPQLLGETLSKNVILQKVAGSVVLSIGLYLLAT